jgi:hypothetical protein
MSKLITLSLLEPALSLSTKERVQVRPILCFVFCEGVVYFEVQVLAFKFAVPVQVQVLQKYRDLLHEYGYVRLSIKKEHL